VSFFPTRILLATDGSQEAAKCLRGRESALPQTYPPPSEAIRC